MMKNITSFVLAFCIAVAAFAQVPQSFGLQTVVRHSGTVYSNANIAAKISILRNSATGTLVYSENHTTTTSANGVATFEVGKGTVVSGVFADIPWLDAKFFVKTEIDPNGGSSYSISETTELRSVPYAIVSGKAIYYTGLDSLMAIYRNRLSQTDSLLSLRIDDMRAIDSLVLIRIYFDSVFSNGVGFFYTSDSTAITFSPANLWYRPSDNAFKMPDHQWDTAGQVSNSQVDLGYTGWIDMFAWGTSGYNGIYPTDTSVIGTDYGNGLSSLNGTPYDWGYYNGIAFRSLTFNAGTWRTPTFDEFTYIFNQRPDAVKKRAMATVNGINGLLLLPDDWPGMPLGCTIQPTANAWGVNVYDGVFWTAMESQGAVFIPACGYLHRSRPYHCHDQGMQGFYWTETSSPTNAACAYYMYFGLVGTITGAVNAVYNPGTICTRDFNHSVRFVKTVQLPH